MTENRFLRRLRQDLPTAQTITLPESRPPQTRPLDESHPTVKLQHRHSGIDEINGGRRPQIPGERGERFEVVPARLAAAAASEDRPRWRIEFALDDPAAALLRLEVAADAVLGRGGSADINLDPYGAVHYAISRRHAMLRPSKRALYFFDLGSRNGSRHNGVLLGLNAATALNVGDVIRLGELTLTVQRLTRTG